MRKFDDATRNKITDMYAHGKLYREIHEATGVSMSSISVICREAGIDKYHKGGQTTRSLPMQPDITVSNKMSDAPIQINTRTLTMRGTGTSCTYVASTDTQNIDITLGDWAISIESSKLDSFISELKHIKKMVGI